MKDLTDAERAELRAKVEARRAAAFCAFCGKRDPADALRFINIPGRMDENYHCGVGQCERSFQSALSAHERLTDRAPAIAMGYLVRADDAELRAALERLVSAEADRSRGSLSNPRWNEPSAHDGYSSDDGALYGIYGAKSAVLRRLNKLGEANTDLAQLLRRGST